MKLRKIAISLHVALKNDIGLLLGDNLEFRIRAKNKGGGRNNTFNNSAIVIKREQKGNIAPPVEPRLWHRTLTMLTGTLWDREKRLYFPHILTLLNEIRKYF